MLADLVNVAPPAPRVVNYELTGCKVVLAGWSITNPQRYQAAVKDLVENKHVIAFVANFAPFTIQAGVKYLESKQVPVIGARYPFAKLPQAITDQESGRIPGKVVITL